MTTRPMTLTADDLCEILHLSKGTLSNRFSADPASLPPAIQIPGHKKPLWLPEDVQAWLESFRVSRADA